MRVGYNGHLVKRTNLGVGNFILQTATALAQRESEDELIVYVGDPRPWDKALSPGRIGHVRRVQCPAFTRWRPGRMLWEHLVLPHRARADGLDLFHATGYVMPLRLRIPVVLTIFDLLALRRPELCKPVTRYHYRALLPASARRAEKVLVPSRAVYEEVVEVLGVSPSRVAIASPGVSEPFLDPPDRAAREAARHRYDLPDEFVFFAGAIEPKKNLARLVRAFRVARDAGLAGELVLAGATGWGADPRQLTRDEDVRWLGYVPDRDLAALYSLASELVFPSLAEGFGLPVLEAMSLGTPVVASPVPAVLESDPEAVFRVDPLSVNSIAEALLRVRHDAALRERLVERGRKASAAFTWQRTAEQTRAAYHEAAGS